METFPVFLTRSLDVISDLHLNKRLSKQSWGWWFEMPMRSLWRHCNAKYNGCYSNHYQRSAKWIYVFIRKHSCYAYPYFKKVIWQTVMQEYHILFNSSSPSHDLCRHWICHRCLNNTDKTFGWSSRTSFNKIEFRIFSLNSILFGTSIICKIMVILFRIQCDDDKFITHKALRYCVISLVTVTKAQPMEYWCISSLVIRYNIIWHDTRFSYTYICIMCVHINIILIKQ